MAKRPSQSKASATKTIMATFQILKEAGGELRGREVIDRIPQKVELSEWEKERYEKTGYIRWESILHFYSIDCIKAGFLRKESGLWILTPEGVTMFLTSSNRFQLHIILNHVLYC
jgi:restriction system protein